jgi:cell division protein FtsB
MEAIKRSAKLIITLTVLVILILMVAGFNNRMAEKNQLSTQKEQVLAELNTLRLTEANLDAAIAYAESDAAVAEYAYQDAHQVRPGDIPVVPVAGSERIPEKPVVITADPVKVENWQVWWALFFDQDLP